MKLGERYGICSYYATKDLIELSDVICLTYSSITNPSVRESMQISLKNSIIVFDEAHNILNE